MRLRHPEWIGCVWRGEAYMPREDRTVIVPAEAVEELRAHGFRPVE